MTHSLTPHSSPEVSRDIVNHETVWLRNFISPQTQRSYHRTFTEFCTFGGLTTSEAFRAVQPAHIIAYREYLTETQGLKPRTIRNRLSALSSLFKHLHREQVIASNPVEHILRPRVDETKGTTPAMTPEQVRRLLHAPDIKTLQGSRDSAILHVLCFCACRIAELGSLKVGDLYEDEGYMLLRFTIKGGKEHPVEVHHELQHAIRRYLALSGHEHDARSPLFLPVKSGRNQGKPLHKDHFAHIFAQYRDQVGLSEKFTPHSARATCATNALHNGALLEDVQRLLNHTDIRTTQVYDKRKHLHKDSAVFAVRY